MNPSQPSLSVGCEMSSNHDSQFAMFSIALFPAFSRVAVSRCTATSVRLYIIYYRLFNSFRAFMCGFLLKKIHYILLHFLQ